MATPKISIVIPTFNAGPEFEILLEKISSQKGNFDKEIVVVDSGSEDGTVELARSHGASVHPIRSVEFNHGATRNLGISLSSGEYVVLTVQDAVPSDENWLSFLVENLEQDKLVAGVYGRQLPRPDSGDMTRVLTNSLLAAGSQRREQHAGGTEPYNRRPPEERWRLAAFDNVNSCLRRSVWEEIPFESTNFGEDLRWGKRVVETGYKLVYEPRSAVFHSHERGTLYNLRRNYVNQRILLELFGFTVVRNLPRLVLASVVSGMRLYGLLQKDKEVTGGRLRHALLAAGYAVPAQVGSYLGTKAPGLSRLSPAIYRKLDRFLGKGI